jgi:tRNA G18 (ribose-2'-O)-methylase SpoU
VRCGWPLYRKALRTSMGAALRVPFATEDPFPRALERLRAGGFEVLALDPRGERVLSQLEPSDRVAVLLGNEGLGLSPALLEHASRRVRIEMVPGTDSLNVAAAAALALHHIALRLPGRSALR